MTVIKFLLGFELADGKIFSSYRDHRLKEVFSRY